MAASAALRFHRYAVVLNFRLGIHHQLFTLFAHSRAVTTLSAAFQTPSEHLPSSSIDVQFPLPMVSTTSMHQLASHSNGTTRYNTAHSISNKPLHHTQDESSEGFSEMRSLSVEDADNL
jgi:hypothetical protein